MLNGNGAGFDLSSLAQQDTAVLEVKHPQTGEPLLAGGEPVTITFAGPGHPKSIAAERREQLRTLNVSRTSGDRIQSEGFNESDVDRLRRERVESVAMRVVEWSPEVWRLPGGEEVRADLRGATKLFSDRSFDWLFSICWRFVNRDASFFGKSSSPSSTSADTSSASTNQSTRSDPS